MCDLLLLMVIRFIMRVHGLSQSSRKCAGFLLQPASRVGRCMTHGAQYLVLCSSAQPNSLQANLAVPGMGLCDNGGLVYRMFALCVP